MYVTKGERKFAAVFRRRFFVFIRRNEASSEKDQENAAPPQGAYLSVRDQGGTQVRRRIAPRILRTLSQLLKRSKLQERQEERGFFDGSLLSVNEREKPQVRRCISKQILRFKNRRAPRPPTNEYANETPSVRRSRPG